MNGKIKIALFSIGFFLGIPAFFNDVFAQYLLNILSFYGVNDVIIFLYPISILVFYLPVFLVVSLLFKKIFKITDFWRSTYFNILGFFGAYLVYMFLGFLSLRNLVGGL